MSQIPQGFYNRKMDSQEAFNFLMGVLRKYKFSDPNSHDWLILTVIDFARYELENKELANSLTKEFLRDD